MVVLAGKQGTCAAKARVDFIEDEKDAILCANLAQLREPSCGRHNIAAASLDGFGNDSGDVATAT